jgi:hypothetical protein
MFKYVSLVTHAVSHEFALHHKNKRTVHKIIIYVMKKNFFLNLKGTVPRKSV